MSFTPLPKYPPGPLYAGNALGQDILDNVVTELNFAGPPLVCCFYTNGEPLFEELPGISLIQDFANSFDAPLIFLDDPAVFTGLFNLEDHLALIARFFTVSHVAAPVQVTATTGPPSYAQRFLVEARLMAGPFMVAGIHESQITAAEADMYSWANEFNRTTQFHRWGAGMQAVSGFNRLDSPNPPDSQRAPLYRAGPNLEADLKEIAARWRFERVTLLSQMNALFAAQVLRPGIDLLVNPINIPYVYLAPP